MSRKTCVGCKFAAWDRTATGRLHPSGDGRCSYQYKLSQLPAAYSWIQGEPKPWGGWINRREALPTPCGLFQPEPATERGK